MVLLFSKRFTGVISCSGITYKLLDLIPMSNNMDLLNGKTYKILKALLNKATNI